MDKTLKLRAFDPTAQQEGGTADKSAALELAVKDAQLQEEKQKSLEHLKTIVQLRESLKQEQSRAKVLDDKVAELEMRLASLSDQSSELERKSKEVVALENKVREFAGLLDKIANLADAGKSVR